MPVLKVPDDKPFAEKLAGFHIARLDGVTQKRVLNNALNLDKLDAPGNVVIEVTAVGPGL